MSTPIPGSAAALWSCLSCPERVCPEEISNLIGLWGLIHEMVGDIDRIRRYPALGFQAAHDLPAPIVAHWRRLIAAGSSAHLLDDPGAS